MLLILCHENYDYDAVAEGKSHLEETQGDLSCLLY
jgi:hypothetical protein